MNPRITLATTARILRQLRHDRRTVALLVSSHVMDEAGRCDRLLLIREGRLIGDDTPGAIRTAAGTDDLEEAFLRLIRNSEQAVAA